jgi:zinc/manganese transport system substrate-binding protein
MNKSNQLIRWLAALVVIAIVVAVPVILSRKTNPTSANSGAVNVVAAENFWGNIAAQIGGNHVNVTSIITDPSTDPHLYESDASDAAKVAAADLVITNGLGYDDFMSKLMSASSNKSRLVLTASQILGISGANANPHLWYNIPRVPLVAAKIEQSLAAKDPADKSLFENNLAKFNASLGPISDTISKIKAKYAGAPVAYTEPVPGYLLATAGLSIKTPESFAIAIEDGNDPSPADNATMENFMTSKAVKVLLYNSQATSPVTQHIRDLARQNNIPVIGVSETLPAGEKTYQSWQLDQTKALLNALGG